MSEFKKLWDLMENRNVFGWHAHGTNAMSLKSAMEMGGYLLPASKVIYKGGYVFTGETGGSSSYNNRLLSVIALVGNFNIYNIQKYARDASTIFPTTPENVDERIAKYEAYLDIFKVAKSPPYWKEELITSTQRKLIDLRRLREHFLSMSNEERDIYRKLSSILVVVIGSSIYEENCNSDIANEFGVPELKIRIVAADDQDRDVVRELCKGYEIDIISNKQLNDWYDRHVQLHA